MTTLRKISVRVLPVLLLLAMGRGQLSAQQLLWEHWYPEVRPGDTLPKGREAPYYNGKFILEDDKQRFYIAAEVAFAGTAFAGFNPDGTLQWEKRYVDLNPKDRDTVYHPQYVYPNSNGDITFVAVQPYCLGCSFAYMFSVTATVHGEILREIVDTNIIGPLSKVVGTYEGGYTIAHTVFARTLDDDTTLFKDATLFKQDSTGRVLWQQFYPKPSPGLILQPASLARADDGDHLLLNTVTDGGNTYDTWVSRSDSLGNVRWQKTIPSELNYTFPQRIVPARNGDALVLSYVWRRGFNPGDSAYLQPVLRRYSYDGGLRWTHVYREHQYDWPYDVVEAPGGGLLILGAVNVNHGTDSANDDLHVIGTDAGGNQKWEWIHGSPRGAEQISAGAITRDGNLIMTGSHGTYSVLKGRDLYIGKLQLPVAGVGDNRRTGASILANYPNPFKTTTTIPYILPVAGRVRVTVCDVLGNTITTLTDERQEPGIHTVRFDGQRLSAGTYFCRVETGGKVFTRAVTKLE